MQSKEHLQTLLEHLIDEHLMWVCKKHVQYDKKMEVVGVVSITIDSDPAVIPVRFKHMIRRDGTSEHWSANHGFEKAEQKSGELTAKTFDSKMIVKMNGLENGREEREEVMTMLDRRALAPLAETTECTGVQIKPVGAQKRKCKQSECHRMAKVRRHQTVALDLSKKNEEQLVNGRGVRAGGESGEESDDRGSVMGNEAWEAAGDEWSEELSEDGCVQEAGGALRAATHPESCAGRGKTNADRGRWPKSETIGETFGSTLKREDNQQSASEARSNEKAWGSNGEAHSHWQSRRPAQGHEFASLMKADKQDGGERLNRSMLLSNHCASSAGDKNGRNATDSSGNYAEHDRCDDRLNEQSEDDHRELQSQSGSDTPIGNQRDGVSRSNANVRNVQMAACMSQSLQLSLPHPLTRADHTNGNSTVAGNGNGNSSSDSVLPATGTASTPECHICHTLFDSLPSLATHYDDEHKYIICQYCGKSFSTRQNLRRHERLHTGQRPYVCTVCQQGFYRRDAMMSHMGRSHTDRPGAGYQCTICHTPATTYNDKFTFRNHMQKKHGVADVLFCNECVLAFGDKLAYKEHKVQVHGDSSQAVARTALPSNGRQSTTSEAAERLLDLHAHSTFGSLQDARGLLLAQHHPELPRTGLETDAAARSAHAPPGTLLDAAAMHSTHAFAKHLSEMAARGGASLPFVSPDMQRNVPPFYPPFPFAQLPPFFTRADPHALQCPLPGLPGLPTLPLQHALTDSPAVFAGLFHPLLLEQLRSNPMLLEKLLAEAKNEADRDREQEHEQEQERDQDDVETVKADDDADAATTTAITLTGDNNNASEKSDSKLSHSSIHD